MRSLRRLVRRGLTPVGSDPLRSFGLRGLSLLLLVSLALPATPAHALRTQAGLESQTADTLTTTLTGLEEKTPPTVYRTIVFPDTAAHLIWAAKQDGRLGTLVLHTAAGESESIPADQLPSHEAVWEWFSLVGPVNHSVLFERDEAARTITVRPAPTDTGLEEPTPSTDFPVVTLQQVEAALAPLDGLQWASEAAPTQEEAIICAGDAEGVAAVVERMLTAITGPKPVAYAVVTSPLHAERLIAAGLLQAGIVGLVYGNDPGRTELLRGYQRAGVSTYSFTEDTAEQALAEALATSFAPGRVVNSLRVAQVLTTHAEALAYLDQFDAMLQFADGPNPDRLTAAITHALDLVSAYL